MRPFTLLPAIAFLVFSVGQAQDNTSGTVEFKPDRLKFKVVLDRCVSKKVKAINRGSASIMEPVFSLQGTKEFRIDNNFQKCPNPLEPGQVCSVYIAFCPRNIGTSEAKLFFSGTETGVKLTGRSRQQGR
ncbi:MAG: hypothetical protein QNI91_06850 [Arenicellales bacterium]|nr:hypothetical protein [Arenicellales bacterium]